MTEDQEMGIVKWFDAEKGFGFIGREGESDVFVHQADVQRSGMTALFEGQRVAFDVRDTPKGPQAENLRAVDLVPGAMASAGVGMPSETEPVSLAEVLYAATLSVFESEGGDPTACGYWPNKTLADSDPHFRIDMDIVGPYEGESATEFFERRIEILEAIRDLAGLGLAGNAPIDYLRERHYGK